MTNQMNQMNRQQLFNLINTVSFAVDDLLLFLDTHPDDVEAIKAFHHYSDIRRNALQVYSDQYGPLTIDTADHAVTGIGQQNHGHGKEDVNNVEL